MPGNRRFFVCGCFIFFSLKEYWQLNQLSPVGLSGGPSRLELQPFALGHFLGEV
jgi:hypothetical protein